MEKKIHYCWFGGNAIPQSAQKCIDSWKKYFPQYEICLWNESNFDIECNDYVKEAYEAKKWAFVSDYARFWILYNYGGLYFDTDVEVVSDFEDILVRGNFMGCEESSNYAVNPGLGIAVEKGNSFYKEMLDMYDSIHFDNHDDNSIKTVVEYTTNMLKKHGYIANGNIQEIEDIHIYPPEYFCPLDPISGKMSMTNNTHSIHHYTATWQTPYKRMKGKIQKILGLRITRYIISLKGKIK